MSDGFLRADETESEPVSDLAIAKHRPDTSVVMYSMKAIPWYTACFEWWFILYASNGGGVELSHRKMATGDLHETINKAM